MSKLNATQPHPLISFALRYSDPSLDYLNAYMAEQRLDVLLDDLVSLRKIVEDSIAEERRLSPWYGSEIFSYYAVGFVTCLEWHAKSRLVDMLSYNPSSIRIEDIKGTISDKVIVQAVEKKASVIQLVGASVKIGNTESYLSVIGRVFKELGFPFSLKEWLTGTAEGSTVCWVQGDQIAALDRLFTFRNQLVHEIGLESMGHPNARDSWDPKLALANGLIVASVIRGVEAAFTAHAPNLFPNLMTKEGYPIRNVARLQKELNRLDKIADEAIRIWDWTDPNSVEGWKAARDKFNEYMACETEFIDNAGIFHWRYFDARSPMKVRMIQYRIDTINELLSHIDLTEEPPDPMASLSA